MTTFEWHPAKAARNLRAHGVSFEEASEVFDDALARIHEDPDHSLDEGREIIVGHTRAGRLLIVAFTERPGCVRLISARPVTRSERIDHERQER